MTRPRAVMSVIDTNPPHLSVVVDGRPAPKGSRIAAKTRAGKAYTYPASKYEKPWQDKVKKATQLAIRHHPPVPKPYHVRLTFRLERPSNASYEWPTKHDLDKLARTVIDGLVAGGAMEDDRHVTALTVTKVYAPRGTEEGVDATIWTDG